MNEKTRQSLDDTTWFAIVWAFTWLYMMFIAFFWPIALLVLPIQWAVSKDSLTIRQMIDSPFLVNRLIALGLAIALMAVSWSWLLRGQIRARKDPFTKPAYLVLFLLLILGAAMVEANIEIEKGKQLHIVHMTIRKSVDAQTGRTIEAVRYSILRIDDEMPRQSETTALADGGIRFVAMSRHPLRVKASADGYQPVILDGAKKTDYSTVELKPLPPGAAKDKTTHDAASNP